MLIQPAISLLREQLLSDFPSGSALAFTEGRLYLTGDDARELRILDTRYRTAGSVTLFSHPQYRIPKPEKADLESAVVMKHKQAVYLAAFGSASLDTRRQIVLVPLPLRTSDHPVIYSRYADDFLEHLGQHLHDVNIEGATMFKTRLIFANRGHEDNPHNTLIYARPDCWNAMEQDIPFIQSLKLPDNSRGFCGVSDLCYISARDILLLTFTTEATTSTYDDGIIGDSYLGIVREFSKKSRQETLTVDEMINLPAVSPVFAGQKIEGICLEKVRSEGLLLHLVADNDAGDSRLFTINAVL
ncbi:hypothetical protein WJU16_24515 [Chitinophaga pollutisoli]|uniref:Uncharacterized protein n=1 Tax=Chitinophaga pollutisoli TaxID=3133966 RepID=A0ABZ2YMW6_9BACT